MKRELFTPAAPGQLVQIVDPVKDWAFIPDPVPVTWKPDRDITELLIDGMTELGRLDSAGVHTPNPELIMKPLRHREALKSSSLEGTFATAEQLLLFEKIDQTKEAQPSNVREVHNYAAALTLGIERLQEIPFCLRLIRDMHGRLLKDVRGRDKRPGKFRDQQVHIGSDRRFVPPPPAALPKLLADFETSIHNCPASIRPLLWAFMVHYQFETIHPFHDGNGRVGRLLLSLMIGAQCDLSQPWLYMSPWFDKHKDEYIDLLFRVSTSGRWNDWLRFCLRGTIDQAKDTVARLLALNKLKQEFLARVAQSGGSARLGAIVEGLFTHDPITTIPNLEGYLKVTYPTAKTDIERLEALGIVTVLADRRPKLYVAWDVIRIGIEEDAGR